MELQAAKPERAYVPTALREEPAEKQMHAVIGQLNPAEEAYLRDAYATDEDGNTVIKTGTEFYRALNVGVIRFERLTQGGEPFEITRDPTKGRLPGGKAPWGDDLSLIPREIRDDIALEVIKSTLLTEADSKN